MPGFVNNLQEKVKVDSRQLDSLTLVVSGALKQEGIEGDPEVSIVLVDDKYIQELNMQYRNIDRPTDVLSFAMSESTCDEPFLNADEEGPDEEVLGDIIISTETAVRQAAEFGHSLEREMAYLTAHGMFHLLGFDHENEEDRAIMREKEELLLATLNITR